VRVSVGKQWDDKPRWSPDGKSLYFLSEKLGYFNAFRTEFDPTSGKSVGEPVQVTHFNDPSLTIGTTMPKVGFSVTRGRLIDHYVATLRQYLGPGWGRSLNVGTQHGLCRTEA
jgi:hypothetical protein